MKTRHLNWLFIGICCFFTYPITGVAQKITSGELPSNDFCEINAAIINNDSMCQVIWSETWFSFFDDGNFDELIVWAREEGECVLKFELGTGPIHIIGAQINVGDGIFPSGNSFLHTNFLLVAYDNDGEEGMPGTLLDSTIVTVNNYLWVECEGLDAYDDDGIFYLGMRQLGDDNNSAPMSIDSQSPLTIRSYMKSPIAGEWEVSPMQNFMVRAFSCSASKQLEPTTQKSEPGIVISRISGFNPTIGETPEDGELTVIDSLYGHHTEYNDSLLTALPSGYYAYGLKRFNYETSTYGDWNYSNAVYHILTGIDDEQTKKNIAVYPNPASETVNIRVEPGTTLSVQVNDLIGHNAFKSNIPLSGDLTIDVSDWPKGLYLILVKEEGSMRQPVKLVVQ